MSYRKAALWLGLTVTGLGCGKSSPPTVTRANQTAPAAAASASAAPVVDPAILQMSLMERLQHEASTRPSARPSVDAVAAALSARGMRLERWKQVLASPLGARFCMAGQTVQGNVVSVCEFGSAAQAEKGLSYSHATFDRVIPNRSLIRRESTLLTISPAGAAAENDEVKAAREIFASL